MRYSKEHKTQTRQRIIDTAAPLFRRFGFDGVSVDKLMNAANLTRGGFYAHFKSKEALIETILTRNAGLVRMLDDRPAQSRTDLNREALGILSDYLDPANLEEIIEGCPLATMPVDATRASPRLRKAYGNRFAALIGQLRRGLGKRRRDEDEAIALAVLAVGGILFARASSTDADAARVQQACSRVITRLMAEHSDGRKVAS